MIQGLDHGLPWTTNTYTWFIGIPVAFIALCGLFKQMDTFPGLARRGTSLNVIMAFEIVAGFCVAWVAFAGCYLFFNINNNGIYAQLDSGDNRVYNSHDFVQDQLAIPMMFFQGWNLLLCFIIADLRDVTMIIHHFLVTVLAYMGCFPYIHLEASFFFGVAELTNIPLTIIDVFKYLPGLKKSYPAANEAMRSIFAVLFIVLRLVMWPLQCWNFWMSSGVLIAKHYQLVGMEASLSQFLSYKITVMPHSIFAVMFFVIANLMLTALQFYWGVTIFGFLFVKPKKGDGKVVKNE